MKRENDLLLSLKNVSLVDEEDGSRILSEVSLDVRKGDRVFVLAKPHRSGMHLLRVCATQYPPTEGLVEVMGRVTNKMGFRELLKVKRHLGFVERISSLVSNMTVLENITLGLRYHDNLSQREAYRHAEKFILELGLMENLGQRPANLPPENLKMALFCRELVVGASLVILERPSHGLSRGELDHLMNATLEYQRESNCGIIIVDDDADLYTSRWGFLVRNLVDGRFVD